MPDRPQRAKRSLRSNFKGAPGEYFFLRLGCLFLAIIPFIGLPNSICILQRYICRNTELVGMPLEFNGKAGDLLKKMFVWGFFSVITLGIYALVLLPVRYREWITAHTVFGPIVV